MTVMTCGPDNMLSLPKVVEVAKEYIDANFPALLISEEPKTGAAGASHTHVHNPPTLLNHIYAHI